MNSLRTSRNFIHGFQAVFLTLVLSACGPRGCFPKFADLKTQYPRVIYKGPNVPSQVVIQKSPPPGWAPLDQISKKAQGAILVSEDWAFYQHPGYDEKQIREAIDASLHAGKLKRGASTITQQVVRNIYLTKKKSLTRKARELWMSTKIEKVLGKKRILELYLNIAEWGEGIYGIGPAAKFYFQKTPAELNAREGAFLAMLLPSPKKYAISYRQKSLTPYARKTIRSVLNKMVMAHYLTEEEKVAEWSHPFPFETNFNPAETVDEKNADDEAGPDDSSDDQSDEAVIEDETLDEGATEDVPSEVNSIKSEEELQAH